MQDEVMEKTERNTRVSSIIQKIDHLFISAAKNKKLSCEIREKLLGQEPTKEKETEKPPPELGRLNEIIDALQSILDTINGSNANLVSVNKEL